MEVGLGGTGVDVDKAVKVEVGRSVKVDVGLGRGMEVGIGVGMDVGIDAIDASPAGITATATEGALVDLVLWAKPGGRQLGGMPTAISNFWRK